MHETLPEHHLVDLLGRVAARHFPGAREADSERALRELYDLTSARLYGLAMRIVGNREWAEDVLQETYITVWRVAGDYQMALSPPFAWMGVIARSRALDFLRRRASERADAVEDLDAQLSDRMPGDAQNPMDATDASQQAWALHECLRRLETRQREVVCLAYLRDLSHSELAQQLRLPLGTVKSWIRRGLEQLRGCMNRYA